MSKSLPYTPLVQFLQVRHYRGTQERETLAKVLEYRKAFSINDLIKETHLPRKSVHRIVKTLLKEELIHFSATEQAYFACQKLYQGKRKTACHSFSICKVCKGVSEFVHTKHGHPRFPNFKVDTNEHEWLGLCLRCKL